MNGTAEPVLSDSAKAQLDFDKVEYQRLQQEIYLRLQMRSTLLTTVLTVAGFGTFVLGPAAGFLLSQDPLFAFAVLFGITVGMCHLSMILYYEMLNHRHYIGIAASYLHNVVCERIRLRLGEVPGTNEVVKVGSRSYGSLDWEYFLIDRVGVRWPKVEGSFVTRWLVFLFRFDQWLRGEAIPAFVAVISWCASIVLLASNFADLCSCHFSNLAACPLTKTPNVAMYHSILILIYFLAFLLLLAVPIFVVGVGASKKVNAQFREICGRP